MFAERNRRVHEVVTAWLRDFFPVSGEAVGITALDEHH
jgi:hypothetical protein